MADLLLCWGGVDFYISRALNQICPPNHTFFTVYWISGYGKLWQMEIKGTANVGSNNRTELGRIKYPEVLEAWVHTPSMWELQGSDSYSGKPMVLQCDIKLRISTLCYPMLTGITVTMRRAGSILGWFQEKWQPIVADPRDRGTEW